VITYVVRGVRAARLVGPAGREIVSTAPGTLGGRRRTKAYGRLDCAVTLRQVAQGHDMRPRGLFADGQTTIAAGYRPCAHCLPERHAAWRAGNAPVRRWSRQVPGLRPGTCAPSGLTHAG
jgi:hypothetical protein